MKNLSHLLENNQNWADKIKRDTPGFFSNLSKQQRPEYLWIGCSDSRVPANEIVGLLPGEIFVHRNIANVVVHSDLNCLSVIQYAVEVLEVKHIIVCGHYGCGGVRAALDNIDHGLIENWLLHIKDIYAKNQERFKNTTDIKEKTDILCELNVIDQVANVCHTSIAQNAWKNGKELTVHGWIYSIENGIIQDLEVCVDGLGNISDTHRMG